MGLRAGRDAAEAVTSESCWSRDFDSTEGLGTPGPLPNAAVSEMTRSPPWGSGAREPSYPQGRKLTLSSQKLLEPHNSTHPSNARVSVYLPSDICDRGIRTAVQVTETPTASQDEDKDMIPPSPNPFQGSSLCPQFPCAWLNSEACGGGSGFLCTFIWCVCVCVCVRAHVSAGVRETEQKESGQGSLIWMQGPHPAFST